MEHSLSLLEACKNGKLKTVEDLVKKHGIENVINSTGDGILGYAPIHEAVSAKSYQILEILLEHGANVNLTADGGYTALHLAASINAKECIEVLLRQKYNTDLKAVDENSHTPFKRAELNNNKKCSQFIKTAGWSFFLLLSLSLCLFISFTKLCNAVILYAGLRSKSKS